MNLPPRPPDTMLMSLARTQVSLPPGEGAALFFPSGVTSEGLVKVIADYDRAMTQAQILALEHAVSTLTRNGDAEGAQDVQEIIDSIRRSSPVVLTDE